MRALVFHPTIPRYLAAKALGAVYRDGYWSRLSPLAYRQTPEPPLPRPDWVRVRVRLGGICGSDLHMLHLDASPAASALTSFPFVPGHENVGEIAETGPAVSGLRPGERVVVDPILPCAVRGISPPCRFCAAGEYNLCERTTDGYLSPGLIIGACRDTGGSWAETFVAHRSQVLPVPDAICDANALMVEPCAVALHPLLRHRPHDGDTVLVVGGGTIGQCVIASLRALGSRARVIALVKYPFQGEAARRFGADAVVALGRRDEHYDAIAELTGARLRRPLMGKRVVIGGADLTVECVGSGRALDDALRLTRSGGRVVLLGLAALPRGVDWTPVWLNELHLTGSYVYGWESVDGTRRRTMEIVLDWMGRGTLDVSSLVTHTFALRDFARAFRTATGKSDTSAFKVAFRPD
ncbi:MAG: alcohol dehydrogenase catalytic domain-containing protein [Armatimonadota bacterium]|nr:alcohol dehydrogenase catalytic domain-containing protein [Armatimonadota bacterium]